MNPNRDFLQKKMILVFLFLKKIEDILTMLCGSKFQVVGTLFTHHQKCVIVDSQAHGNNRKITAFIGGLDLCDGRYDTPEHRILSDLDTVYKDDYHNPTFSVSS